ncbi:MAG: hypothetical protein QOJ45_280 [Verrucomicrobiota bacterium]
MILSTETLLTCKIYFSYSQFLVFDQSVPFPGCAWTEGHSAQGFARRKSVASFGTLLEFGFADVEISVGKYEPRPSYQRVIAVPFLVVAGEVLVQGPEETAAGRSFALSPGNYRLVSAQYARGDDKEVIGLFFEPLAEALERSAILVADEALAPPTELIEDVEPAD